MADFPTGVYSPRTKANKNGVVYAPEKETIGYAEDITKLDDEVVAIETELGANPKGAKADVKTRLDDVDTAIDGKQAVLTFGIADNNAVEIDDADAESGDYAKFTADGLEGKSAAEVRTDLNILQQKSVVKTADETVNNSNVLQNDDALVIAVGANEKWKIETFFVFNSSTVADFKFSFTGPAGSSAWWGAVENGGFGTFTYALGGTKAISGMGQTRIYPLIMYISTIGTPGNVQFQWAQSVAEATDTKVLAGSNIIASRLN